MLAKPQKSQHGCTVSRLHIPAHSRSMLATHIAPDARLQRTSVASITADIATMASIRKYLRARWTCREARVATCKGGAGHSCKHCQMMSEHPSPNGPTAPTAQPPPLPNHPNCPTP
eukprot:7668904-Alexandrium_andersonii.AAC.1